MKNTIYLTGFADEASKGIEGQIQATQALGWKNIEARSVDGKNLHDLPDADFDRVSGKLVEAGIQVNCFGSAIANWGKSILDPADSSLAEARRAIPRMKRLGTKLIRIMSFAVLPDRGPEDQMKAERFRRLRELQRLFTDEGLTPVHENCMNYGGMGWKYTLELIENVPGLKLVFDTANPINTPDYAKPEPRPKQSAWEFYEHVREHVAYIHIKDACFEQDVPGATFPKARFTWPGEGHGDVVRILTDLLGRGYQGGISIEPHMAVVCHDKTIKSDDEIRMQNYIEYGRRTMAILDAIAAKKKAGPKAG